jgi:hypothetical protein
MEFSVDKPPSYKQFMQNMERKMQDSEFWGDTELLLWPDADKFDPESFYRTASRSKKMMFAFAFGVGIAEFSSKNILAIDN